MRSGKPLYASPLEATKALLKRNPLLRDFAMEELRVSVQQYHLSKNGVFMWRAWQIVRRLDDFELVRVFIPYFNECADRLLAAEGAAAVAGAIGFSNPRRGAGEGNNSALPQEDDFWLLANFNRLTTRKRDPLSPAAARRELAKERLTTADAIKQRLLRITKTGQYAHRSRRSK